MKRRPAPAPQPSTTEALRPAPVGGFVALDGQAHYRISNYAQMEPFLVSLASDSDLWMFITSGGGLTAGRVDADGSLFPYLTVDQLHDAHHHTGPLTLIQVGPETETPTLWEPFSDAATDNPQIQRNLYKNTIGSRLVFEEINQDLGLVFRYSWSGSEAFGWVRSSTLENLTNATIGVTILDGLRNILPHGAPLSLYQQSSNLVDAYKKSEVDPDTGLGIFSLAAGITDRAEALEVLKANTVWCCGLDSYRVHLDLKAVSAFRREQILPEDALLNGARGNYLISSRLDLAPHSASQWHMVADVGRDHIQISELRAGLLKHDNLSERIEIELQITSNNLLRNVGSADGLQLTGSPESTHHHFANVLFNNMRGGVFAQNYDLSVDRFADFLRQRNRVVALRQQGLLDQLPDQVTVQALRDTARQSGDKVFERLCFEYLPLHFGRRHGDPSRPWNKFAVRARNQHGERAPHYEGNWRDIFQNWEALCTAFPDFLPSIIAKFVNASTVDGFNPYRITQDGVDWETVDSEDPWSNIGYWGDHQIVYLLKLLEVMTQHDPTMLTKMLGQNIFSFAEVPYIIKPYAEILQDPMATIKFDGARAKDIDKRVADLGTDGKLLKNQDGSICQVTLLEKLLVPALAKLSNLIPDAGIWMNTQRPEWNDANNALGGGGVSVVTLCYLRRYLAFLAEVLSGVSEQDLPLSSEVAEWLSDIGSILEEQQHLLDEPSLSSRDRKQFLDAVGLAFCRYRKTVYDHGFSGRTNTSTQQVLGLCKTALKYLDWGIQTNRRDDGLFHAYNLLDFNDDDNAVSIVHLQEMLEGQVAVLSSGILDPEEGLLILQLLYASDLYRADQHSFMLYPERTLPGFLEKNVIPAEQAQAIGLLQNLLDAAETSLVAKDQDDQYRFHGTFGNATHVAAALDKLAMSDTWAEAVAEDRAAVLDLFEDTFKHKSYTGRSGVMYGYEGLGCIYWHMVAKLLLAVQEMTISARLDGRPQTVQQALTRLYYRIRSGLGYEKSVAEYGAFPTDPYSHTPADRGAKQPGMTGQVKEEILTRRGELGLLIEGGTISFQPTLLRTREFLKQPADYKYFDVDGHPRSLHLPAESLAFTVCQVPIVYTRISGDAKLKITFADGSHELHSGTTVDAQLSLEVFSRSGLIDRIDVKLPKDTAD